MTTERHMVFVSPRFLFPADSGGKIRTTQILRGLKGGAFRITLVMPATGSERQRFAAELDTLCDEHLAWEPRSRSALRRAVMQALWLLHRDPLPVASDYDSRGAAVVGQALDGAATADVVVFDFPHSAVLAPAEIGVPSVMFTHNIEAEIFDRHRQVARWPMRWLWRSQHRKMRGYEQRVLSSFDGVIAVSERDCGYFRRHYGITECGSIPTGVDLDFFRYEPPSAARQVVFCGSMDWMANVDGIEYFASKIWPLIRNQVPDARMKVVGRAPSDSLVERITRSAPDWEFTGFVDDVRDHIPGAAAFVIPLRVGGGTRIKAFEAMAMGTPVVSTSIGVEGLPVEEGTHYLRADTPDDFAARVVALLTQQPLRERLSRSARELVESCFDTARAAVAFERLCLETIARRRPA